MDIDRREALINRYIEALDTDDVALFGEIISDDFVYYYTDEVYRGREATLAFLEHDRNVESDHEFVRILHDEDCSIGHGRATVTTPTETFEAEMCDLFTFDDDRLASVKIFPRS